MSWLSETLDPTLDLLGLSDKDKGGGGGGSADSVGGLSPRDRAFIDSLYDDYNALPQEYQKYTGDRFADLSVEEQALLDQIKAEGGYNNIYGDTRSNLGLSGDFYRGQSELTNKELLSQANEFRNPFDAEMQGQIQRSLTQSLSDANIANNASAFGAGAGGGSRQALAMQPTQEALFRGAGDALANLQYRSYTDSLNRARQANLDRLGARQYYDSSIMNNLGLTNQELQSRMGAYAQDRGLEQQDLDFAYKQFGEEQMFPYQKLQFGGNLIGTVPLEQKQAVMKPASGGK